MALKQLPEDFKDFLNFLSSNKVEYLLLGGWRPEAQRIWPMWRNCVNSRIISILKKP